MKQLMLRNLKLSVAKSLPFKKRFIEMAGISLTVAGISFLIGICAGYLIFTETGKKMVNNIANAAVSQAAPAAGTLLNAVKQAANTAVPEVKNE